MHARCGAVTSMLTHLLGLMVLGSVWWSDLGSYHYHYDQHYQLLHQLCAVCGVEGMQSTSTTTTYHHHYQLCMSHAC